MKKLKKLKLNKQAVINLDNGGMNQLKGGGGTGLKYLCPIESQFYINCNSYYGNCPNTDIIDCPNHSQVGSGCNAETCGWAPTCNG